MSSGPSDGFSGSEEESEAVATPEHEERPRNEREHTWRRDDRLLERFFPVDSTSDFKFSPEDRKRLYNDSAKRKRWKKIPATPKSVSRLYTPLTMLMNDILRCYGISTKKRLFLNTSSKSNQVISTPSSSVSPSLFLAGIGNEFANTSAEQPRALTQSGLSPIEVALDSDDVDDVRDRLASSMHQMFQNQDNRRFAFGLIITETLLTVYMFDHSGIVFSDPFNYHQQPEQFCAVISSIASDKAERTGFDDSIFSVSASTKIRTFEPNEAGHKMETLYLIKQRLFQFPTLIGRGTICWLTSGVDDPESRFVVKDAWIAPEELLGRESEGSLLHHAKTEGVVSGVVQVRHFEEVRRNVSDASELDSVLRNRKVECPSPEERKLDRVHTRIVMETYGKTLDRFSNRRELLFAFHDAVLAHRNLHDVAGILHRDISVRNILIKPEAKAGDRGILIDFDHAIRVGDTSPYSTKTKIGTRRYMSRNVLDAKSPHTYLDDLESFYYVWCYILVAYVRPGIAKAELPKLLALWDHSGSSVFKDGLFAKEFRLPVAPWFGSAHLQLAVRLHRFFRFRPDPAAKPPDPVDSGKDYDEFLSYIQQAITDMEKEPGFTEDALSPCAGSKTRHPAEPASRGHDVDGDKESVPNPVEHPSSLPKDELSNIPKKSIVKKRGGTDIPDLLNATKRPRRSAKP